MSSNDYARALADSIKADLDRERALRSLLEAPPHADLATYAHALREADRWARTCRLRVEAEAPREKCAPGEKDQPFPLTSER